MSQSGPIQSSSSVTTKVETLEGNSGGPVSPDASFNIDVLGNNGSGINIVGTPASNLLTVIGLQASESQRGTVELATNTETTDGISTSLAVHPAGLNTKLGTQTDHGLIYGQGGAGSNLASLAEATNGQLVIGSTGNPPVLAVPSDGNNISWITGAGTLQADVTGTTNHAIQLGNASGSLTSLGVATNGQLPIGSTGADPILATLTAGNNITITNGAGSITIDANGGGELAITALTSADSTYTVLSSDEYLSCDVSGGVLVIDMPDAPTTGRIITVKDSGGDAATNNITVTTVGGVVNIDGATTYVMNTNYQAARFIFNGSTYEVF